MNTKNIDKVEYIAEMFRYPKRLAEKVVEISESVLRPLFGDVTVEEIGKLIALGEICAEWVLKKAVSEIDWKDFLGNGKEIKNLLRSNPPILTLILEHVFSEAPYDYLVKYDEDHNDEYIIVADYNWKIEDNSVRIISRDEYYDLPNRNEYTPLSIF